MSGRPLLFNVSLPLLTVTPDVAWFCHRCLNCHLWRWGGDLSLSGTQRFSQRSWCLFVVGDMFDLPSVCLSIFVILEILHMCQMIDGVV